METIYVKENINKISESLANQNIDLKDIGNAQFSFFPKERIIEIAVSKVIGKASLEGFTRRYGRMFSIDTIDFYTSYNGYAVLNRYDNKWVSSIEEIERIGIGKVFTTLEEYFAYILPKAEIIVDPFTKSKNMVWDEDFCYQIEGTPLNISLEYREDRSYICFSTLKDIKVQQGDTISLLFESGRIVDFPLQKKPIQENDYYNAFCVLYQEDLELFINENCCRFRITYCKNGKAPLDGEFVDNDYSPYGQEVFSAYAKHYLNELKRLIPDYQLPQRTVIKTPVEYKFPGCYVYLMLDNSNGYHKIGISNTPEYREKTLQSEKPSIEMLACKKFPTRKIAEAIESALHTAYSQQRVRGEWFNLDDVDVAAIIETLK